MSDDRANEPRKANYWKTGALVLSVILSGVAAGIVTSQAKNPQAAFGTIFLVVGLLVAGFLIYFLPTIIAVSARHHNAGAIAVLNFLAGWTVLGWLAALVWACTTSSMKLFCPRCRAQNLAGSRFCRRCAERFY